MLDVLAIQTGTGWQNSTINAIPGITITVVSAPELMTINFSDFDALYVSDVFDAPSTPDWAGVLNDRTEDILAYLNGGGFVLVGGQNYGGFRTNGDEYNFLGGLADAPADLAICLEDVVITEPDHPLFDGLTSGDLSDWLCSYHGFLDMGTLPVLATSSGGDPVIRGGPVGAGGAFVWTLDPDFHFDDGVLPGLGLVENAIGLVEAGPSDSDGDGIPDDEDDCPDSDLTETIVIGDCDSGVLNHLFDDGCTMSDLIAECAESASNHGQFVSCVSQLTNEWKSAGLITGHGKGAIQSCAAQSTIPGGPPLVSRHDAAGAGGLCTADINGDGVPNVLDLIDLLLCFGQPAFPGCEAKDVNQDGTVNVLDLIDLLLAFGTACP